MEAQPVKEVAVVYYPMFVVIAPPVFDLQTLRGITLARKR